MAIVNIPDIPDITLDHVTLCEHCEGCGLLPGSTMIDPIECPWCFSKGAIDDRGRPVLHPMIRAEIKHEKQLERIECQAN